MAILAIQSQVIAGHVGNAAAVPALQAMGEEVFAIPTVLLSHHPGHGGARGAPLDPGLLTELVAGLAAHGALARARGILSGYLGRAEAGMAVAAARKTAPQALYLCDPVLGDDGRLYVGADVVAAIRHLAATADIVTPNSFELELLSGLPIPTRAAAFAAMGSLGRPAVVLTSFAGGDTPAGTLDILLLEDGAAHRFTAPARARKFSGAGDLFAALLLAFRLRHGSVHAALPHALAATQHVLAQTERLGTAELALIASPAA